MSADAASWTLTARWVFPADQPPLARGVVTIQDDKILAVEPAGARKADIDLGNAAILPGLVNAHTHLDLSDARGKIPPTPDFTAWLRGVIQHRREQESVARAIVDGIVESTRYGVTLLGDIAVWGLSWDALTSASVRAVVYHELVGLSSSRALSASINAMRWLSDHKATDELIPGLSPHAPYSFCKNHLSMVGMAKSAAIHLAESAAELDLLERQVGAFVVFLSELDVWDPSGLPWGGPQQIIELASGVQHLLLVHCNYLRPETPIPSHATIVYCPRTHAAFGHPPHPFREFLKRGVRVVLGTDSLASNPDLDILAEARFVAARHPDLPGETLLRMITLDGAIALGWGDVAGSLTPGKSADLVALPLPDREEEDPYRLVFDATSSVQRVCFRGTWNEKLHS